MKITSAFLCELGGEILGFIFDQTGRYFDRRPGSHEINRSRRDWSRMYFASRLRKRRMTILNLSEKVNHISASAFCTPIDSGYRYALQYLSALYRAVDCIQQSDQQADFKLLPSGHHGTLLSAGF
jgi:hypothetical protein